MRELRPRVFWACVLGMMAVICIPSAVLLETFQRYWSFLQGMEEPALRPSRVSSIFHRGAKPLKEPSLPQFVEFRFRDPKAKSVFLTGDFAQWKPNAYAMRRQDQGLWEIALPLLPGRYHYLFIADQKPRLDPANRSQEENSGRKSSLKIVP